LGYFEPLETSICRAFIGFTGRAFIGFTGFAATRGLQGRHIAQIGAILDIFGDFPELDFPLPATSREAGKDMNRV
jgi:hypothetical protein